METVAHHVAVRAPRSPLRAAVVAVAGIWLAALVDRDRVARTWLLGRRTNTSPSPRSRSGSPRGSPRRSWWSLWRSEDAASAIETSVGAIIALVSIVVAAASIWSPVMQTGADPTIDPPGGARRPAGRQRGHGLHLHPGRGRRCGPGRLTPIAPPGLSWARRGTGRRREPLGGARMLEVDVALARRARSRRSRAGPASGTRGSFRGRAGPFAAEPSGT